MFKKRLNSEENKNTAKSTTIIAQGTIFKGNIDSNDSLRIDGEITGDIETPGKVIVGTTGKIIGNIIGNDVMVSGMVKGDIHASNGLFLKSGSKVEGNIAARILSVEQDAIFKGSCQMDISGSKNGARVEKSKAARELITEVLPN
jgi:cytoskeletal protein CcmA (bactofilin family)